MTSSASRPGTTTGARDSPTRPCAAARVAVAVGSPEALQPQVRRPIRGDRAGFDGTAAVARTAASRAATGGIDWVAWVIGGVAFAAVLGLAAVGSSRVTRPRVIHR